MSAQPKIDYREYEQLMDDYANSEKEVRRLRRVVSHLQRELNDKREDSPIAKDIRSVLDHYVMTFRKTKAFKVGTDTERWRLVEKALKDHKVGELKQAIDGLAAMPYVGAHGRQPVGSEDQRHDDIEICMRNEIYIDRFRGYVEKARRMRESEEVEKRRPKAADWAYDEMDRAWDPIRQQVRAKMMLEPDPVGAWLGALSGNGLTVKQTGHADWMAQCPAHEDRSPSLHLTWNENEGRLLVFCHAGCETVYVADALGLPLASLFQRKAA